MRQPARLFVVVVIMVSAAGPGWTGDPPAAVDAPLTLGELGFADRDAAADPALQRALETRSFKLQMHQVLGISTLALMTGSLAFAPQAKRNEYHQYLGIASVAAYWTTFYLAETAPKPAGVAEHGWNIRIHKAAVWVHAPLMILTPIAGVLADEQIRARLTSGQTSRGRHLRVPLTGLASVKAPLGSAAFLAYALGTSVMFFEF